MFAEGPIPSSMQGTSVRPVLLGEDVYDWCDSFLYEYYEHPAAQRMRKNRGIRTRQWKLVDLREQPESFELYNLKDDPDETRNLASDPKFKNVFDELKDCLAQLRKETHDVDLPNIDPGPCEFGVTGVPSTAKQ